MMSSQRLSEKLPRWRLWTDDAVRFGPDTPADVGKQAIAEATGTMTFDGRSHTTTVPPTSDLIYMGAVCGPNVKGGGN